MKSKLVRIMYILIESILFNQTSPKYNYNPKTHNMLIYKRICIVLINIHHANSNPIYVQKHDAIYFEIKTW